MLTRQATTKLERATKDAAKAANSLLKDRLKVTYCLP